MKELEKLTKKELYQIAKELKIRGRSKMRKGELLEAVRKALFERELLKEREAGSPQAKGEERREVRELQLPKDYGVEFVAVIPVNPELAFAYWSPKEGEGKLKLFKEGELLREVKVNLKWGKYYLRLEPMPFERIEVELEVEDKELKSRPITMPSNKLFLPQGAKVKEGGITEVIKKIKELSKKEAQERIGYREKR
ncbi:Rho termination factor N-terminal domain-containing protein [Thermovibrio sp.]